MEYFNRGYSNEDFLKAVKLLNQYNIDIVTHIMVGLPGEEKGDILNTVNFINSHKIMGVKIHSTYIIKNTVLEKLYLNGEYKPLELCEYVDKVCEILEHLKKDIVICRITGDAPKDILIAPEWNLHKKWIINGIEKKLKEDDLWQGKFFEN